MRNALKKIVRQFLTRKYQFSLAVLLPLFLILFALGPLFITLSHVEKILPAAGQAPDFSSASAGRVLHALRIVMAVSAAAALAAGIALSYAILAPLRRFAEQSGVRAAGAVKHRAEPFDDFGILGRDFGLMMSSLNRHVSVLESLSGGVIAFDRDGRVTTINSSAERILGRHAAELLGMPLGDLCRTVVQCPEMERLIRAGLSHDRPFLSEEVAIIGPGGAKTVIGLTTSLLKDNGKTSGVVANFMDLSGIRLMHEDLQQRLRLSGLGMLAAGVAHEVRNPLGAIKGMAQLIQEDLPDNDPRKKYCRVIEQEAERLNSTVEGLLSLAHGPDTHVSCDLNALVLQARELASHALRSDRVEIVDERGDVPLITAERGRLVQALLNLFLNAFEAVPADGRVRFKTSYSAASANITIEIGNSGTPIPQEVQERMFEPFYTTKEKGTGLGLAIAHQIIAAQGGAITVTSTEQETVFRVTLPAGGMAQRA